MARGGGGPLGGLGTRGFGLPGVYFWLAGSLGMFVLAPFDLLG